MSFGGFIKPLLGASGSGLVLILFFLGGRKMGHVDIAFEQ